MTQMAPPSTDPVLGLRPEEGLSLLLIGTVWSSFLIPVVVLLFHFSDSPFRRRPVFLFNTFSVILGLVEVAVIIHTFSSFVLDPSARISSTVLTVFSSFVYLIPPCVQSVLLFRVISGCIARHLSTRTTIAVCSPTVAVKCARVTIASILLARLHGHFGGPPDSDGASVAAWWQSDMTYVQVLWFLQLCDDIYVSSLLAMEPSSCLKSRRTLSHCSPRKLASMALASFAIPILLDICQVVQSFLHLRFAAEVYIPLVNGYVQIICVLVATICPAENQHSSIPGAPHDSEASLGSSMGSQIPYSVGEHRFQQLTSPSVKEAFSESIRDSNTAVGEEDAEERLKWLAELGKERTRGPSLATAATFDNTGQPAPVFYAV
ncbi:hypothetical protein K466DRAFT_254741 [Polyporus arcularius HHB13444]|uniref:Uncharacterized protein n=1 Tax=Polyporus arcularius HHB13444 TaxID=1314778 RepID=A0A5C3P2C4_9APHY|nr:hypothetical protein K466DRAFT_254741 [Polyporus arcularius HHB13444]